MPKAVANTNAICKSHVGSITSSSTSEILNFVPNIGFIRHYSTRLQCSLNASKCQESFKTNPKAIVGIPKVDYRFTRVSLYFRNISLCFKENLLGIILLESMENFWICVLDVIYFKYLFKYSKLS